MSAVKAYIVTENCENTGGVVFAKRAIVARREGADRYGDGDFHEVSCRRAKWADVYAESGVPAKALIEDGWHFECYGCQQRIDDDFLARRRLPLGGVLGSQDGPVYCCVKCKTRHLKQEARRKAAEAEAIAMMRELVLKRFPGAQFVTGFGAEHAYVTFARGGRNLQQAAVSFKFPGMSIGPATLRLDKPYSKIGPVRPEFSCCYGDKAAFEAWAGMEMERPNRPGGSA